jgi:hypothetical protein
MLRKLQKQILDDMIDEKVSKAKKLGIARAKILDDRYKDCDPHAEKYHPPVTAHQVIETVYKKQIPDAKGHLEVEEKVVKKKKGGAMKMEPPMTITSNGRELPNISSTSQSFPLAGSGSGSGDQPKVAVPADQPKANRQNAMKKRNEKVKEYMKKYNISMIEASKKIKAEGSSASADRRSQLSAKDGVTVSQPKVEKVSQPKVEKVSKPKVASTKGKLEGGSRASMIRRAQKVKEVMQAYGLSMIEASKKIKADGIEY